MSKYTSSTLISVYPFTRQQDDSEVIIGQVETASYLVLPVEAVEILDFLALGKTVGETRSIYKEKYGENPDIEDLLEVLEEKGFIKALLKNESSQFLWTLKPKQDNKVRYHFSDFSQSLAQNIFGSNVLIGCSAIVSLALILILKDSSLLPNWKAYYFPRNTTLMILIMVVLDGITLFLHEMAHLIAARAQGVNCRMGISNRMWTLVAETDMTGIWSIPRRKRYLPFLAGPILDIVCAAILIIIFFAQKQNWLNLSPLIYELGRALLLNYLLGLLWQMNFFMRTDFYYVIANYFKCKSLMKDTEVFFKNQFCRIFSRIQRIDQSHIPIKERRIIYLYSIFWVVGRITEIATMILITLPLMWNYCAKLYSVIKSGFNVNPYAFIDALFLIVLALVPMSLGFFLWIRSFRVKQR